MVPSWLLWWLWASLQPQSCYPQRRSVFHHWIFKQEEQQQSVSTFGLKLMDWKSKILTWNRLLSTYPSSVSHSRDRRPSHPIPGRVEYTRLSIFGNFRWFFLTWTPQCWMIGGPIPRWWEDRRGRWCECSLISSATATNNDDDGIGIDRSIWLIYLEMVGDLLHILDVFCKWNMRTQPGRMGSRRIVTAEVNNHQRWFYRHILKQPNRRHKGVSQIEEKTALLLKRVVK